MNWLDFAAYITMSVVIATLTYFVIFLVIKSRRLVKVAAQAEINRMILSEMLTNLMNEKDDQSVESTEGFLKFISDSRDWAFDYIEKVQDAINAYDEALSKDDAVAMNEAYKNLLSMLPQDDVVK
jgi:hypothetical protein